MKSQKSLRIKKPTMTPDELISLRKEMRLDRVSLAQVLDVPYPTLRDYEGGRRGIPQAFAKLMKAAHRRDRNYMQAMGRRLDRELSRLYPRGIVSELEKDEE